MKKLFFTLCALCLCGTMWAQTYQDETTSLYFTVTNGVATIVASESGSYTISNLVNDSEGVYSLPTEVTSDGQTYAVTTIGASAFENALTDTENLIHLVIPEGVDTLNYHSFYGCTQIGEATVEYSTTALRQNDSSGTADCFVGCSNIKTVTTNRNLTHGRNNQQYGYVVWTFSKLPSIETAYIGENVNSLTNNAFNAGSSGNLAEVYCYAVNPPTLATNCFLYKKDDCVLYVHSNSLDLYQADEDWVNIFGENIKAMNEEEEEQPEGTLRDVDTGLYFGYVDVVVDNETVPYLSIVADASGVYTDDNLVKNSDGSYTLPSYVEDKSGENGYVTRVDENAFDGSSISGHLVIPATILRIGKSAFKGCTGLTEVTYEYSETALEDENSDASANYSFEGCTGVKTVNLNRNVNLGSSSRLCAPFCYTTSITTVYIGEYVTKIPNYMFRNNRTLSLSTVYCYATTPPTLGSAPFDNLASEHNLYVNYDDVNTYKADDDWEALFGKANIHSLTGEDPDEPQVEGSFKVDGLWYVPIYSEEDGSETGDAQIIETQDDAYTGTISIPATVENEGKTYNVTRIDASAFEGASILGHLVIPATITAVGEKAFQNCTGLTEVTYEYSETALQDESAGNNTGTECFLGCSGVTTVNLNRDITIGSSGRLCAPFCYNTSVTTVYIGENVTLVPDYMFRNNSTKCLSTVYSYASTPPTLGANPFDFLADEHNLYVHYNDVNTYKADDDWREYFGMDNIHSLAGEGPNDENAFQDANGLWYDPIFDENGEETGEAQIIESQDDVYTGTITIPATVENDGKTYNVTRIDAWAFENTEIEGHVIIPANILKVGSAAFLGCTKITEVTFEYSPTALADENTSEGTQMFYGCSGLTTVHMNRDITLGLSDTRCAPFSYNTSVTTVYIGEYVTEIPDYMFYHSGTGCLSTVYSYASTPPTLGRTPFDNLASERNLYVNYDDVNTYKADASWRELFGGANIHSLTGEDPKDENAFQDANGLWYDPIFDENGEETGEAQIIESQGDAYIGTITIPATVENEGTTYNVTRINTWAFENTEIEGHVIIPANILTVGAGAFMNCTGITEVTFEYSPTALADENTATDTQMFANCTGVEIVNLYRDVTSNENHAAPFCYLTSIINVNIGPRVTSISPYMFYRTDTNNPQITLNVYNATPPTGSFFSIATRNYTINVPQGAEEAYTSSWSAYYTGEHEGTLSNAYAVDITLTNEDGYYYATYYNSKAVDIYPEGGTENVVTSYAVSGVEVEDEDEGYLDLAEVGATVPAETAVLVEATAEGTYTIIETTAAQSASYAGENDLYGYDEATEVTDNNSYYYYTLSHPASGGSLGFYWATSDGSATNFTSAAHKAYLMLLKSEVENLKSISLRKGDGGGDTTGITSVESENEANTVKGIYTLQGVRVNDMNQKGVYIVDGKKVLVK